jgi:hypothetical protein
MWHPVFVRIASGPTQLFAAQLVCLPEQEGASSAKLLACHSARRAEKTRRLLDTLILVGGVQVVLLLPGPLLRVLKHLADP